MTPPLGQPNSPRSSAGGPAPELRLLVHLEPRLSGFFSNCGAVWRRASPGNASSPAAPFWTDVFVGSGLPWRSLAESALTHALIITAVWSLSQAWIRRPQLVQQKLQRREIIYYEVSDYLPAIQTPMPRGRVAQKPDPAYAAQQIVSVPPQSDNRSQTIVTPPDVKLAAAMPLPNLVAWTPVPSAVPVPGSLNGKLTLPPITTPVIAPPPDVQSTAERAAPMVPQPSAVAPAPELSRSATRSALALPQPSAIAPAPDTVSMIATSRALNAPPAAVIGPPPAPSAVSSKLGSLNIADLQSQIAAPQLPVPAQHTATNAATDSAAERAAAGHALAAPDAHAVGFARGAGQLIALGLAPSAAAGAIEVPQGNRRGMFASSPYGRPGASGTPESTSGGTAEAGNGNESRSHDKLAGITLSPGPLVTATHGVPVVAGTGGRNLLAVANIPANFRELARRPDDSIPAIAPSDVDRQVFGARKFYSLTLNMPNLNSSTGSWVIRFAELHDDGAKGDLTAPVATEKVDPAYPALLMREHVEGTVTLYAVIHSDGRVGDVRVLRGVDDRLDAYAREALARCRFRPATKNGNAVALEAVIRIPFQAHRIPY